MNPSTEPKDKDYSKFDHEIIDGGFLSCLSNVAVRVYLVILRYADYKTRLSYPTVATISKCSRVSKNLIPSATEELVLNGLIQKWQIGKKARFRNCYRVVRHPKTVPCTRTGK